MHSLWEEAVAAVAVNMHPAVIQAAEAVEVDTPKRCLTLCHVLTQNTPLLLEQEELLR